MAVTAYKTIFAHATDTERLAADVTAAIADGWQPNGAAYLFQERVYQPMICGGIASVTTDYILPAAGAAIGGVKIAAAQVDTTAADLAALKVDFNALLAKFRTSGVLTP